MTAAALSPELVLEAYRHGMFPMADSREDTEIGWYIPKMRAIVPLDEGFNIPRSLAKFMRDKPFEIRMDTAFEQVIHACAEATPDREESWINPFIISLYTELHQRGMAHSVECWQEGVLVGGLYGLHQGGAFFGESMFSRVSNASKVALVALVAHLRMQGFTLLDSQYRNEHLMQFGMVEMPHKAYMKKLAAALELECRF